MHKFWYIPDLLILSILSMLEAEILIRGLLWLEDSEPPSAKESSNAKSISFTHLWQTLCWQGRISGWVNNSLHAGQISSLSIPLMATFMTERGRNKCKHRKTRATKTYGTALTKAQLCRINAHSFIWFEALLWLKQISINIYESTDSIHFNRSEHCH